MDNEAGPEQATLTAPVRPGLARVYETAAGKLRRALSLPGSDRQSLFSAWFLLLGLDLALRMLPARRVRRLLTLKPGGDGRFRGPDPRATAEHLGELVGMAARNHLYPMGCLRRALALRWLLRCRGIHTELRFGARKEADRIVAHSWLEYAGKPVAETPLEPFTDTPWLAPVDPGSPSASGKQGIMSSDARAPDRSP
jgi:hypothetical protein